LPPDTGHDPPVVGCDRHLFAGANISDRSIPEGFLFRVSLGTAGPKEHDCDRQHHASRDPDAADENRSPRDFADAFGQRYFGALTVSGSLCSIDLGNL
jgi:hypothetical protein